MDLVADLDDSITVRGDNRSVLFPLLGQHFTGLRREIGKRFFSCQNIANLLTQSLTEEAGQKSSPGGLLSPGAGST